MKFYITEEEKRLINEKMAQLPTRRYGAYLRKMAIDGYIIYTDTADIKAFTAELSAMIPCSYWASIWLAVLPTCMTSYEISVRQTRDLPVS